MTTMFKSEIKVVEMVTPQGEPVRYTIEYRWDSLDARVSIICSHLKDKWKTFYSIRDEEWLNKTIGSSKEKCPFCKPMLDQIAARFSKSQMEEDLLKSQDIYIFPNLYPRTAFEAVVTSPAAHTLDLDKIDVAMIYNFLNASIDCIKKAYKKNDKLLYPVIGCNYLPPAGASLIHFHMQISIQEFAFLSIDRLIRGSRSYWNSHHTNFWLDLIEANQDREIALKNNVYWYAPFAPEGFSEVRAIVKRPTILEFTEEDMKDLADGLAKILKYYNDQGFSAFNFIIYSGRLDSLNQELLCGLQIIARPNLRPNYLSIDSWYMPLLLGQTIVLEKPEDLAHDVRNYF